ncbi:Cathepsin L [Hypsibius exemplaris]|uniref:Cathepsin L n=1 Tax=Hypsibius exemplaris TaxID=2072580 RepID=A0A1W0X8Y1_HYPEX|nr:Cathepsin L [Hypsibius exemplaris]
MWLTLLATCLVLGGGACVLIRDPKNLPCDDYDLFDPVRRVITEPWTLRTDADYEYLAQQAVHQSNARSNSLYKSMLVRLKSRAKTSDGDIRLTVLQLESKCRNDGKFVSSLAHCPLRENGLFHECELTVSAPTKADAKIKLRGQSCVKTDAELVLGYTSGLPSLVATQLFQSSATPSFAGFQVPLLEHFRCFALRYGKTYDNDEERALRFRQFQNNMKLAYLLQATEQGSGVYGPTQFSDLHPVEFRKLSTGLDTRRKGSPLKAGRIPDMDLEDLPVAFDWRDKNAVTPVKDQGQCGSCWAFSTTGNVEGQWAIKKGKLVSLSEQELVDCDKLDQGCGGGLPSNAYKEIIRLGGMESEGSYPYDGSDDKCSFQKPEASVYINDSISISTNETEIAMWLAQNGPISIGINANAMMLYMGGVSHPWKIVCNPKSLDHGVLIVGYGVATDAKKNPYWIVKNSWGPHWGVKGYYLVYRGDGTCGLNLMCTSAVIA